MKRYVIILMLLMAPCFAWAAEPNQVTEDPLDARVRAMSEDLRCLVCQGQSLAESHSDFAADMRNKIHGLMAQGMTDDQVRKYLVDRYGEYILFRPPLESTTVLLWFGPLILFLVGGGVLVFTLIRRRKRLADQPLSDEENARVKALLSDQKAGDSKA